MCLSPKITTCGSGILKFDYTRENVKNLTNPMTDNDFSGNDNCIYVDQSEYDTIPFHPTTFTVMQLNIRGLINKQSELIELMDNGSINKVDVALICETWLRHDTNNMVKLPKHYYIGKECMGKKGGGVGILIDKSLKFQLRPDLEIESNTLEHIVVEIKGDKNAILLASCYRAPNTDQNDLLTSYGDLLQSLKKEHCMTITGLDHNLDLLKNSTHRSTQSFLEQNYSHDLLPCILKPRRVVHHLLL